MSTHLLLSTQTTIPRSQFNSQPKKVTKMFFKITQEVMKEKLMSVSVVFSRQAVTLLLLLSIPSNAGSFLPEKMETLQQLRLSTMMPSLLHRIVYLSTFSKSLIQFCHIVQQLLLPKLSISMLGQGILIRYSNKDIACFQTLDLKKILKLLISFYLQGLRICNLSMDFYSRCKFVS